MKELFEISKRGLLTAQRANAAIGHNIANANTDGYSRQRVVLSPLDMKRNGYSLGRGVEVQDIQRLRSNLLDKQIFRAENQLGGLQRKAVVLHQVEGLLITGNENDLDGMIDGFFNALSELSNTPQDKNLRKIVVSKAETMTMKFRNTAEGLGDIKDGVEQKAKTVVGEINSLLKDLAGLNTSISLSEAKGTSDHNSKDIQVQKLKELSGLIDIETKTDKNGALEVTIDGIKVLSGNKVTELKAQVDVLNSRFHVRLENGKAINPGGGQLAADIELYEDILPGMMSELDTLAATLVEEFNAVHRLGYELDGTGTGQDFFDPAGTTAATMGVAANIVNNPSVIAASSQPDEPGNNSNLLDLVQLREAPLLNNRSFSFNATQLISGPGIELSEIQTQIDSKTSEQTMLMNQQESIAGVNLDEEMTNLIMFQNAYQASARVLGAAQQMYDTLLSIVR